MKLSEVKKGIPVIVTSVKSLSPNDIIADRLGHLGFVPDEPVQVTATGPFGGDPILVRVGNTKFALRKEEAARVSVVLVKSEGR